jgi:diguanylate cyclase (GGDEF)-like protein/PAS domain S-box-containing protein
MSLPADRAVPAGPPAPGDEAFEAFLEALFEDATRLAIQVCEVPIAALSLLQHGHHWFKSRGGVSVAETPRALALCSQTMSAGALLVLPDVAGDRRFREDPLLRSGLRFFAGIPLLQADGAALGTLSVMDREPRELGQERIEAFRALGHQIERQLRERLRADELQAAVRSLEGEARRIEGAHRLQSEALAGSGEGFVVYDRWMRHVLWNPAMERFTGLAARDVLGRSALQVFPELKEQGIAGLLERALAGETVTAPDVPHRRPGVASTTWLSGTYSPHRDDGGRIVGVVGVLRDVGDRRREERAASGASAQLRLLVEQSPAGMFVLQDDRFRFVNPRLSAILGFTAEELYELPSIEKIVAEDDRELFAEQLRLRLEGDRRTLRHHFRSIRKDGESIEAEITGTAADVDGRPALLGTLTDVTDRKRSEARIAEQVYHDPLTKLPNRVLFLERLELALAQARRHGRRLAIVYLDLDRFKLVNDTRGHSAGDALLQSLALRLKRRLRQVDTLARVGGDEFVILMPDARPAQEMTAVAQKLLEAVSRPFQIGGQPLRISASLGIASFPDDGESAETLMRNADVAMYRAKELGRNNFQLCTPELTSRAVERLALQSGLRQALDRDEFAVHYQPIVSLVTGRVVGLEALVRWEHPEQGLVMPGSFVSAAEESGLIVSLGEWVLRTGCRELKRWQRAGLPELRLAVNFSARQFREDNLVHMVGQALAEVDLEPQHLEVEITESIAMESAEIVVGNLRLLRGMGVGIAIDDFGTGYSSLNYLKRYPVTALKIDRSFVTDLPNSAADAGIVRAIVELAHGTKLSVIAEGVETKDQFLQLQQHGCDEMQGNWVSPPLTAGGVDHLLEEELKLWAERA